MTATATATATAAGGERLRVIYEANAAALMRAALNWTPGDQQAAEDLVQETMLRAWRSLHLLPGDPGSVRPWLLTVAQRLATDSLRARAARPTEVEDEPLVRIPVESEPFEQILDRQVLREAIANLSDIHRDALTEVHILRRSVREAAATLGIPEGTVRSRTHHALRSLRQDLGGHPHARR